MGSTIGFDRYLLSFVQQISLVVCRYTAKTSKCEAIIKIALKKLKKEYHKQTTKSEKVYPNTKKIFLFRGISNYLQIYN